MKHVRQIAALSEKKKTSFKPGICGQPPPVLNSLFEVMFDSSQVFDSCVLFYLNSSGKHKDQFCADFRLEHPQFCHRLERLRH